MSYAQIITFSDSKPNGAIEYRNSWGGAAFIWSALFDRYLKNPAIPYDSWLGGQGERLWSLAKREDLPMFERAAHAFTFDCAFVRKENFGRFAKDLRDFASRYPKGDSVCHLPAWADLVEKCEAEAVGLYGTSVGENLWFDVDPETGDATPKTLADGFEVYDWLESLTPKASK